MLNTVRTSMLAVIAGLIACFSAPAYAAIGEIKTLKGTVEIVRDGETLVAKLGDMLEQSDIIRTAANSQVGIVFADQTRFSAGPKSKIELTDFNFDMRDLKRNTFKAKLSRGTVSVISGQIAKSYPDAMTLKTPTTILGVRGTNFLVRAGGS